MITCPRMGWTSHNSGSLCVSSSIRAPENEMRKSFKSIWKFPTQLPSTGRGRAPMDATRRFRAHPLCDLSPSTTLHALDSKQRQIRGIKPSYILVTVGSAVVVQCLHSLIVRALPELHRNRCLIELNTRSYAGTLSSLIY